TWQAGDTILDLYEVRDVFTSGGMGLVYRVHHRTWDLDLAVKCPRPEYFRTEAHRAEFVREAETWVDLGLHPHIVTCHYVRTLGGIPRIFAEFVEGGSLKDWIRDRRLYAGGQEQALERILDVAIQFAWGLAYAHEQGLVHQDVKPANVLMTSDGTAKVTDFGLARARAAIGERAPAGGGQSVLVSAGGMTPAYCSPEQAARVTTTRRTDVWSWGVSLLEMFAGEVTWLSGQAAPAILEMLLQEGPAVEGPPTMPAALADLLRHCFQQEPAARPASMAEVAGRLQGTFQAVVGRSYGRQMPRAAELRADGLNNKALSLLDLGREQEAAAAWEQALAIDPTHAQTVYNLGLWRRIAGQQTDGAWLRQLEHLAEARPGAWMPRYLLGLVYLARNDRAAARLALEAAAQLAPASLEVQAAMRRLDQAAPVRCLRTLQGRGPLAMTADGQRALMGGQDTVLPFVDLDSGDCLCTLEGHEGKVWAVAITPDGRLAVSGGEDRVVRVWDLPAGRLLLNCTGHGAAINAVAVTSDGRLAVSGGDDKLVLVWDLANRKCLWSLGSSENIEEAARAALEMMGQKPPPNVEGHTDAVRVLALAEGRRWAVSGGLDGELRVWDLDNGTCLRSLAAHAYGVYALAVTPDAGLAVSGGRDNACVWDLRRDRPEGSPLSELVLRDLTEYARAEGDPSGGLAAVALSQDGAWAITGGHDKTLRAWNLANGAWLCLHKGYAEAVHAVAVSADGRRAISAEDDGTVRVWQLPEARPADLWIVSRPSASHELQTAESRARQQLEAARVALASGQPAAAAAALKQVFSIPGFERDPTALDLWHAAGRRGGRPIGMRLEPRPVRILEHLSVNAFAVAADGRLAVSGSYDKKVQVWNLRDGACLRTMEQEQRPNAVAIARDGSIALAAGGFRVWVWDLASGQCLHILKGHRDIVNAVAITSDGSYALSGSDDETVRVWELSTGKCVQTWKGHRERAKRLIIAPDGRRVLAGNGIVSVSDLASGKRLCQWRAELLAITPDGHRAVSTGERGTLRVWDLESGKGIELEGHTDWVLAVTVAPDGRFAASTSRDDTVRIWDLASGACLYVLEEKRGPIAITPDGRNLFSNGGGHLRQWILDWDYEFPEAADWDEGARPYLECFLALHTARPQKRSEHARPEWGEEDFQRLLTELGWRGYGWLRPEGVRRKLEEMARQGV
ncbi:MAG: protein kinase, partial [Anaerolineae bacterium]|nr:protein kinase [Anaerolineae bacterium]